MIAENESTAKLAYLDRSVTATESRGGYRGCDVARIFVLPAENSSASACGFLVMSYIDLSKFAFTFRNFIIIDLILFRFKELWRG